MLAVPLSHTAAVLRKTELKVDPGERTDVGHDMHPAGPTT
jgi:hypothetical protein